MRHRTVSLSVLAAAIVAVTGSPALAEHEDRYNENRRDESVFAYAVARYDEWRQPSRRDQHHDAHCRRVWIPGEYRSVTRRVWVRGHYDEVVIPWKVEWTWVPRSRGHRTPLTVITDNPHAEPPRPERRIYGPGHWDRCVLQEYRVERTWMPGHYELVERTIQTPGRYEMVCRHH